MILAAAARALGVAGWLAALSALPVLAEGTLAGRSVTLGVLTYDDPAHPLLTGTSHVVTVGEGTEFGMGPEGFTGPIDIVPATIDIRPSRITFSYPPEAGSGQFFPARFNGYVLGFAGDCALFDAVRIVRAESTLALGDDDLFVRVSTLYINVQGLDYGPAARLVLDLDVADCPMS